MIGRRRHPHSSSVVFIPLRQDERGAWVPLGAGVCDTSLQAAEVCADTFASAYEEIAKHARILRALCEHPGFEFVHEGIDTDMVRSEACILEELIRAENENVARMLDEPDPGDVVRLDHVPWRVNKEGLLEPRVARASDARTHEDETEVDEADTADLSSDELLADLLTAGLTTIEQTTGESVSRQGVEAAIARLRALHEATPSIENGVPDEAEGSDQDDDS